MIMKKIIISVTTLAALVFLGACSSTTTKSSDSSTQTTETSSSVDLNSLELPQLSDEVAEDETLVEMVTSAGSIKIKLFPTQAPKAVENFVTHAKEGYYNGTKFHRVIEDFMIQGGDPKGDGTGGESIWGDSFENEISNQLYNIRGALAMANSGGDATNGSQFFIVQNKDDKSDGLAIQYYPEAIIEAYKKGGVPQLDGGYTVFGQVVDNDMEVVDKIATSETTGEANSMGEDSTLKEDVTIKEIKILQEAK
ncbi:peptidylprolyl isomerase [Enterococcus asini]|uniref:peptidylprolyl isomerase n=1 Tax=Enterococcus asini TaxID=57732 RepID=UPI00288EAA61|nr:peptidylprolyl isomerase [Enterococcus asini]MDT2757795.1 peptidylprolyl isomerase [Enterococcus asini]